MVKGEEFWKIFVETQEKCDKQCSNCEMYLAHKKRCLHESMASWRKWVDKKRGGKNNE